MFTQLINSVFFYLMYNVVFFSLLTSYDFPAPDDSAAKPEKPVWPKQTIRRHT